MREHTFDYTLIMNLQKLNFIKVLRLLIRVQYDTFSILMKNIVGSDTQNLIIPSTLDVPLVGGPLDPNWSH